MEKNFISILVMVFGCFSVSCARPNVTLCVNLRNPTKHTVEFKPQALLVSDVKAENVLEKSLTLLPNSEYLMAEEFSNFNQYELGKKKRLNCDKLKYGLTLY